MAKFSKVFLEGTDVTSFMKLRRIEEVEGSFISKAVVIFSRKVDDVVSLRAGLSVIIQESSDNSTFTDRFNGKVVNFLRIEGALAQLICEDKFGEGNHRKITEYFDSTTHTTAGKISEIWKHIINNFTNMTADSTSVSDSGTIVILNKLITNRDDVMKILEDLRELLNWTMGYDPLTDRAFFKPKGTEKFGTKLIMGSNCFRAARWEEVTDHPKFVNDLTLVCGFRKLTKQESFTASASQTKFSLADVPVDNIRVTVNTTEKIGGFDTVTANVEYTVTVDPDAPAIVFGTGLSNSDAVVVQYTYNDPIVVVGENPESIVKYGHFEKEFKALSIEDPTDARSTHRKILNTFSVPLLKAPILVKDLRGFKIGMSVEVSDNISKPQVNDTFIINKIIDAFPSSTVRIEVGEFPNIDLSVIMMGELENRVRELEKKFVGEINILLKTTNTIEDMILELVDFEMWKDNKNEAGRVVKRRWKLTDPAFLALGKKDRNIDISHVDIRLGIR